MCSDILLVIVLAYLLKRYSYKRGYKDRSIEYDNDQICNDCKASIDCKRLDYYGYREYCKWEC